MKLAEGEKVNLRKTTNIGYGEAMQKALWALMAIGLMTPLLVQTKAIPLTPKDSKARKKTTG